MDALRLVYCAHTAKPTVKVGLNSSFYIPLISFFIDFLIPSFPLLFDNCAVRDLDSTFPGPAGGTRPFITFPGHYKDPVF